MDLQIRYKKIGEILEGEPIGKQNIYYAGRPTDMPVYRVPIELTVFNEHNHRIASWIKTLTAEQDEPDASTPAGEKIIMDLLYYSDEQKNEKTITDIKLKGQQQVGVITRDGVVADGNRRCLALRKLEERGEGSQFFLAAILPDTFAGKRKEIMQLETMLQLGVDDKVDYDPIQKYIKVKDLIVEGYNPKQIAGFMGESEAKIQEYQEIFALIDRYLEYIGAVGAYQILVDNKLEGYFFNLAQYVKRYSRGRPLDSNWTPNDTDINDLIDLHFDYFRLEQLKSTGNEDEDNAGKSGKYGSQELRPLGNPAKGNGIFTREDIWKPLFNEHDDFMDGIEEKSIDEIKRDEGLSTVAAVRHKDREFTRKASASLRGNFERAKENLQNFREKDRPTDLLSSALKKLEACQKADDSKIVGRSEIWRLAKEINHASYEIMKKSK
jgi:hypothetical protein